MKMWCMEGSWGFGFTHVDPFEDTERTLTAESNRPPPIVSPTSIRSRILKGPSRATGLSRTPSFTHVDPFEDTERHSQQDRPEETST